MRKSFDRGDQHLVDESRLAFENIDVAPRDFTVHQKGQAKFTHALENSIDTTDIGNSRIRVGRCAGWIKLAGKHRAAVLRSRDFDGIAAIGQIERHQRRKARTGRQCSNDTCAVFERGGGRGDRWLEIRHHDGAGKSRRRKRQNGRQSNAIAQVQMPVIGASNLDLHSMTRRNSETVQKCHGWSAPNAP